MKEDFADHPALKIEAKKSRELHMKRVEASTDILNGGRRLKHHHHHHHESESELEKAERKRIKHEMKEARKRAKHQEKIDALLEDSGIGDDTMHGMMIDAGSSGSRMHVFEWKSRILVGKKETAAALAGKKLSYPNTNSRWTDRLKPGIATFATLPDEELYPAIEKYLKPLMDFAEAVLHTKNESFAHYPIYLKATAGARMLTPENRKRLITACRDFFSNSTHSQFMFNKEHARVISGEEEAIYGWTGANFALGSLIKSSQGIGTVVNPDLTYGTVEIGGASSQVAFYQNDEDIMANLFKLQIGQGRHWNVYAHSYLYFGINEAWNRMGAHVSTLGLSDTNVPSKVENPCLAGSMKAEFESTIWFKDGHESFIYNNDGSKISYKTQMRNEASKGSYDGCTDVVKDIIHKQYNTWCEFAHHGSCAFNGVYQPVLPVQDQTMTGEFLGLSNYFDVFDFLQIPPKSSLRTLQNATKALCEMSTDDLTKFNDGRLETEDMLKMCFQSVFAFELLNTGVGFGIDDNITAIDVVNGQKVGWALGSMLYEINTLPWAYVPKRYIDEVFDMADKESRFIPVFIALTAALIIIGTALTIMRSGRRGYQRVPSNSVSMSPTRRDR